MVRRRELPGKECVRKNPEGDYLAIYAYVRSLASESQALTKKGRLTGERGAGDGKEKPERSRKLGMRHLPFRGVVLAEPWKKTLEEDLEKGAHNQEGT